MTWQFFQGEHGEVYGKTFGVRDGPAYGLSFALLSVLLSIILAKMGNEIRPTEILAWSLSSLWRKSGHWWQTLLVGLFLGPGFGFTLGLSTFVSVHLSEHYLDYSARWKVVLFTVLGDGLTYVLAFVLAYWLLPGLFGGLSSKSLGDDDRIKPNEGIWRSLRISIGVGLCSALVSFGVGILITMLYFWLYAGVGEGLNIGWGQGLHAGLDNALHMGLSAGPIVGLQVGFFGGLLAGLLMGGLACLRHYVLRWLLKRSNYIPPDYANFLDSAAKSILLRKVGGGYEFVHILLRDYFASLGE